MRYDNGRYVVRVDGLHVVATDGGRRVCFVIDGEEEAEEFASSLPDAHLQPHRRELFLRAGQVVTTSPSGRPLEVELEPPEVS